MLVYHIRINLHLQYCIRHVDCIFLLCLISAQANLIIKNDRCLVIMKWVYWQYSSVFVYNLEKMHASAFGQIKTVYNECMTILISPDLLSTNYLFTISSTKKNGTSSAFWGASQGHSCLLRWLEIRNLIYIKLPHFKSFSCPAEFFFFEDSCRFPWRIPILPMHIIFHTNRKEYDLVYYYIYCYS